MNMVTGRLRQARDELGMIAARLAGERDELRLRMHLARTEVRHQFEEAEHDWEKFQDRARAVAGAADGAGREVAAAARLLAETLGQAYRRIRDALDD